VTQLSDSGSPLWNDHAVGLVFLRSRVRNRGVASNSQLLLFSKLIEIGARATEFSAPTTKRWGDSLL
jgi:hypothetical protein